MLVLSRRQNESIELSGTGVTITVLKIAGNRIQIGIEAPKEVSVRRSELARPQPDRPCCGITEVCRTESLSA